MTTEQRGDEEDSRLKPLANAVIGPAHRRVLMALADSPMSAPDLAKAADVSRAEAEDFINDLIAHGLAQPVVHPQGAAALTDLVTVAREGDRVFIRASNPQGEFVEVRFRP